MNLITIGGISGILLTLISIIGILVSSIIFQLDWNHETLSEMGSDDALETNFLFNFTLILGGIFSIIFSTTGIKYSQHVITKLGFVLLLASSFFSDWNRNI